MLPLALAPLAVWAGKQLVTALKTDMGRQAAGMAAGRAADAGTRAAAAALRAQGVNVPPGVEQVVAGLAGTAAGMGAGGGFPKANDSGHNGMGNQTSSSYDGTGRPPETPRPQPQPPQNR